MNETRYCRTCGALLAPGAELCGECGARYATAPWQQRASDAPTAWAQPPRRREPPEASDVEEPEPEPAVRIVSRDELAPPPPGATRMRGTAGSPAPAPHPAPSFAEQPWGGPSAPVEHPHPGPGDGLAPPLDGCECATLVGRLAAALVDGVVGTLLSIPLTIGAVLIALHGGATLLAQILVGVGAALVVAGGLILVWLQGSRAITPGKALLRLRTVGWPTGRPIGFLRALGRAILLGLPFVGLVMLLGILIDSRTRRGLHDRAVGSIVLDARRGRDPLRARPDDFARESDERFVPSRPVPVSTHDNLMSVPGAPWGMPEHDPGALWDAPASRSSEGIIERSPWAPSEPQAPADERRPDPAPDPARVDDTVVPASRPSAVPDGDEDDDDLDRTRVAVRRPKPRPRVRAVLEDGTELEADAPAVLGRNPSRDGGAAVLAVPDTTRSISKSHLRLDVADGTVVVTDLGSTNGTVVESADGETRELEPDAATEVAAPARLRLGDRTLVVEIVR